MCIRNHAGQNAIDVRKVCELRMLDPEIPIAVGVFAPMATPSWRVEAFDATTSSEKCETCEE